MVIPDNRDERRTYTGPAPLFGPAPAAVLEGLAAFPREVEVHVLSCLREPAPAPRKLAENIHFHGLRVPRWSGLKCLYLPQILAVRRGVRSLNPDVVHGQGTERYCALAAVWSGRPALLTIHGNMRAVAAALGASKWSFHGLTAGLEEHALNRSEGVVCPSQYTQRQVGAAAPRTWVVPNAVSGEYFIPRSATPSEIRLLCPALICRYKNQNTFIRAMDPIAAEKDVRLIFAGNLDGGPYGEEFKRLISERPWCQYLGNVDAASLKVEYAASTMVVLPSLEDNCPMTILEAMAMSIPVAAGAAGGIPELVSHGSTGYLFDPRNGDDIRDKMNVALHSLPRLAEMGRAARIRAEEVFKPEVIAMRHLDIYRETKSEANASHAASFS